MSVEARLVCYLIAFILFIVEAVRARSLGWAAAAAFTLVPLWDALEAT